MLIFILCLIYVNMLPMTTPARCRPHRPHPPTVLTAANANCNKLRNTRNYINNMKQTIRRKQVQIKIALIAQQKLNIFPKTKNIENRKCFKLVFSRAISLPVQLLCTTSAFTQDRTQSISRCHAYELAISMNPESSKGIR